MGLINTVLGFAVILLCMSGIGMAPAAANAAGIAVGYLAGYTLHRRLTFRSDIAHRRGLAAYLAVTVTGYAVNLAVLMGLIAWGTGPVAAQAVAVASYVALTFFLNARFVFRRTRC